MDNEMIERCVKAILDNDLADSPYDRIHTDDAKMYTIAMIKAMREPTEKMLSVDAPDMPAGGGIKEIWQDIIDSIVNE